MYFKLVEGSEAYNKLNDVWERRVDCNRQAIQLCKELGFEDFGLDQGSIAGGIGFFQSKVKPEGYKTVGKKWQNFIFPKANNKKVLEKINALPKISLEEYNETIGFKAHFSSVYFHRSFGCYKYKGVFYIEISDNSNYEPIAALVEILPSEYLKIKKKHEEVKKAVAQ